MSSHDVSRRLRRALSAPLPDVWGEGILFGFSGIDGETVTASGFVGSLGPEPYGVLFHTPTKRQFSVRVEIRGRVVCATGDALVVEMGDAELAYGWLQWHSLIGVCPPAVELSLGFLGTEGTVAATVEQPVVSTGQDASEGSVALLRDQDRFALCYGHSPAEAIDRCHAGIAADVAAIYRRSPQPRSSGAVPPVAQGGCRGQGEHPVSGGRQSDALVDPRPHAAPPHVALG